MTYSISSYLLPSLSHKGYPFQEPDVSYSYIRPENKNILISVIAYVPGSKSAATLLTDALTEFFDDDIVEEIIRTDAETLSAAAKKYISEHTGWFFRHEGIAASEYAVLALNLDTNTFVSFTNGECIVRKGPVDDTSTLCESTDYEEGSFSDSSCFLIANSTVKEMAKESSVLSEVICRAMRLKNDEEYFDIAAEGITEIETPSHLLDKQDAFIAFIPVSD